MSDDIVARLRRIGTISDCEAAADEIERLRKERDEARRLVCYDDWLYKPGMSARKIAAERGWDCFKENT